MQAVMEGLEQREVKVETDPPEGALGVRLHPYQKLGLTWLITRDNAPWNQVRGGILADEQVTASPFFLTWHPKCHAQSDGINGRHDNCICFS